MIKKMIPLFVFIMLMILALSGCTNQYDSDAIGVLKNIMNRLEDQIQPDKNEITSLKSIIKELEEKVEKNNENIINKEPIQFENNDIYRENGKIVVVLDLLEARTIGVNGAKVNDYHSFDILVVNERQEVQVYSPEIEYTWSVEKLRCKLIFPEVEYKKIIVRIYELSTGRIAETCWINSRDI